MKRSARVWVERARSASGAAESEIRVPGRCVVDYHIVIRIRGWSRGDSQRHCRKITTALAQAGFLANLEVISVEELKPEPPLGSAGAPSSSPVPDREGHPEGGEH